MIITTEEANKQRLEEARKTLGCAKNYIDFDPEKAIHELEQISFEDPKTKKKPILTLEDSSSILNFPFFVYDFEEKGYLLFGSINSNTTLERKLFEIGRAGTEKMFEISSNYYNAKKELIKSSLWTISPTVYGELEPVAMISRQSLGNYYGFLKKSKNQKSVRHFIEHEGGRHKPHTSIRKDFRTPSESNNEAYHRKSIQDSVDRFYLARCSFAKSVLEKTEKRKNFINEIITQNNELYQLVLDFFGKKYKKMTGEYEPSEFQIRNDPVIITEAVVCSLALSSRVNLFYSDHHFDNLANIRQKNLKNFDPKLSKMLEGKTCNVGLYKQTAAIFGLLDEKNVEERQTNPLVSNKCDICLRRKKGSLILSN